MQHYGLPPFPAAVTDFAFTSTAETDFAPISQLQVQRELFGEIISGGGAAD